jgi:hypothetical protein
MSAFKRIALASLEVPSYQPEAWPAVRAGGDEAVKPGSRKIND